MQFASIINLTSLNYFLYSAFHVKKKILICSSMAEPSMWMSQKEASELLSVDEKILELLREEGYLKPGSHWRSSNDPEQLPWRPKAFYLASGCKEVIEYFQDNEVTSDQAAA